MEVEVKSAEEAFQVFWKGEFSVKIHPWNVEREGVDLVLFYFFPQKRYAVMILDVTDLELLVSGSALARKWLQFDLLSEQVKDNLKRSVRWQIGAAEILEYIT